MRHDWKSALIVALLVGGLLSGCASRDSKSGSSGNMPKIGEAEQLFAQAQLAYDQKNYNEAERLYQETLKKAPNQFETLYRLGNIAFRREQFLKAREYYERSLRSNPKFSKAHYNLGTVNLILAEQHLRFFLSTAPKGKGNTPAVMKIIGDIDVFARGGGSRAETEQSSDAELESIADEFVF